jgi:hypothetical protein
MTAYCLQLPAAGIHPILSNSRDKVRATATIVCRPASPLTGPRVGTHMHRNYIAHAGTQMKDPLFVGRPKQPNTKRWRRLGTVGVGTGEKSFGKDHRDFRLMRTPG